STPMRPNRPHISSIIQFSKSEDTKQTTHPNFGRLAFVYPEFSYERFISRPVPSRLHRCVCSSSVRRYLGSVAECRKRKNAKRCHFLVTPNVYRGFPQCLLLQEAVATKAKGANPGQTTNLRL
ncbi:hypothetical protein, partial [Cypionkella aquatica]|uniref:hypothetical protein n=1 Tax=Cypionkella aquatica TaxID=1756042 RepID=UPI0024E1838D